MSISAMFIMNLVVAVVLDQFQEELEREEHQRNNPHLDFNQVNIFQRSWTYYHPIGRMMPIGKLPALLRSLRLRGSTLVPSRRLTQKEIIRFIDELDLPTDGLNCHYVDVMYRLCWKNYAQSQSAAGLPVEPIPSTHDKLLVRSVCHFFRIFLTRDAAVSIDFKKRHN